MIITCNCGEKKFTLPDNSIPVSGRMVQCGFCGLKWKQFPVGEVTKPQSISRLQKVVSKPQPIQQKIQKSKKVKKTTSKKQIFCLVLIFQNLKSLKGKLKLLKVLLYN